MRARTKNDGCENEYTKINRLGIFLPVISDDGRMRGVGPVYP